MTLTGKNAIRYAQANGLTLSKYEDPTEEAREGLTVAEAEAVAREDANLIYLPGVPDGKRYEVRVITDSGEDTTSVGALLFVTDNAAEAKAKARELGTFEYYGTAIVDRTDGMVDFGHDADGGLWIEPLGRVSVNA